MCHQYYCSITPLSERYLEFSSLSQGVTITVVTICALGQNILGDSYIGTLGVAIGTTLGVPTKALESVFTALALQTQSV